MDWIKEQFKEHPIVSFFVTMWVLSSVFGGIAYVLGFIETNDVSGTYAHGGFSVYLQSSADKDADGGMTGWVAVEGKTYSLETQKTATGKAEGVYFANDGTIPIKLESLGDDGLHIQSGSRFYTLTKLVKDPILNGEWTAPTAKVFFERQEDGTIQGLFKANDDTAATLTPQHPDAAAAVDPAVNALLEEAKAVREAGRQIEARVLEATAESRLRENEQPASKSPTKYMLHLNQFGTILHGTARNDAGDVAVQGSIDTHTQTLFLTINSKTVAFNQGTKQKAGFHHFEGYFRHAATGASVYLYLIPELVNGKATGQMLADGTFYVPDDGWGLGTILEAFYNGRTMDLEVFFPDAEFTKTFTMTPNSSGFSTAYSHDLQGYQEHSPSHLKDFVRGF